MIRKLKTLSVALIAATAIGVAAAAPAAALEFKSEIAEPVLEGGQEGADVLMTTFGKVQCEEILYKNGWISIFGTTFTVSPSYNNCSGFGLGVGSVSITMNGCLYAFHTKEEVGGNIEGKMDISCPAGKSIVITANDLGEPPKIRCTITIGNQEGLETVTYTNKGAGAGRYIQVDFGLTAITYTEHAGTGILPCKNGLAKNGAYTGKAVFIAKDGEGKEKGFWVE